MDELLPLLIWAAIVVLGAIRNASRQRSRTGRPPAARSPQPRPRAPQALRPRLPSPPAPVNGEGPPVEQPMPPARDEGVSLEWQEASGPRAVLAAQAGAPPGGSGRPPAASAWAWAVVMAEVLGPPRALRPYRGPVSSRWRGA